MRANRDFGNAGKVKIMKRMEWIDRMSKKEFPNRKKENKTRLQTILKRKGDRIGRIILEEKKCQQLCLWEQ